MPPGAFVVAVSGGRSYAWVTSGRRLALVAHDAFYNALALDGAVTPVIRSHLFLSHQAMSTICSALQSSTSVRPAKPSNSVRSLAHPASDGDVCRSFLVDSQNACAWASAAFLAARFLGQARNRPSDQGNSCLQPSDPLTWVTAFQRQQTYHAPKPWAAHHLATRSAPALLAEQL